MARDWTINGATMAYVRGGNHNRFISLMSGGAVELGLSADQIRIIPRFVHQDMPCNDFSPSTPPDVLSKLADVTISMVLVHYDQIVLDELLRESLGNWAPTAIEMTMGPYGTPLGGGLPMYYSGNHLAALSLVPCANNGQPAANASYRFKHCYLEDNPVVIPLGANYSMVDVRFRAIPYVPLWYSGPAPSSAVTAPRRKSAAQVQILLDGQVHHFQEVICSGNAIWDSRADTAG